MFSFKSLLKSNTFSHCLEEHLPTETSKARHCSGPYLEHVDGPLLQATDNCCISLTPQQRGVRLSHILDLDQRSEIIIK